jgi:transposase-like protein
MKGHGAKLPRKKQQAISALLQCMTIKEAAQTVGVGESTLFRWLNDHEFKKAYGKAKRRMVDHAITQLQRVSSEAVNVLWEIMTDPEKPPSSRVTAAKIALDFSLRALELQDISSRLERLETAIYYKK